MLGRQKVAVLLVVGLAGASDIACGGAHAEVEPPEVVIPAVASAAPARARPSAAPRPAEPDLVSRPVVWAASPEAAREMATRERKPMLLFIRADWAAASLEMERGALADPGFERASRSYVLARLDATESTQGNAYYWMQTLAVTKIPAIALIDPAGRREIVEGAMSADELVDKLNAFVERR